MTASGNEPAIEHAAGESVEAAWTVLVAGDRGRPFRTCEGPRPLRFEPQHPSAAMRLANAIVADPEAYRGLLAGTDITAGRYAGALPALDETAFRERVREMRFRLPGGSPLPKGNALRQIVRQRGRFMPTTEILDLAVDVETGSYAVRQSRTPGPTRLRYYVEERMSEIGGTGATHVVPDTYTTDYDGAEEAAIAHATRIAAELPHDAAPEAIPLVCVRGEVLRAEREVLTEVSIVSRPRTLRVTARLATRKPRSSLRTAGWVFFRVPFAI